MVGSARAGYSFPAREYWGKIARLDVLDRLARAQKRSVRAADLAKVLKIPLEKVPEPPEGKLTDYYIGKILGEDYNTVKNVRRGLPTFAKAAKFFVRELSDTTLTGLSYYDAIKDKRKQLAEARGGVAAELFRNGLWDLNDKQLIVGLRLRKPVTVRIADQEYTRPKLEKDPALFQKMKQLVNRVLDGEPRLTAVKALQLPIRAAENLESTMLKGERTFKLAITKNDETMYENITVSLPMDLCIATSDEFDELQLIEAGRKLTKPKFGIRWRMTVGGPVQVEDFAAQRAILVIRDRLKKQRQTRAVFERVANEVTKTTGLKVGRRIVENIAEVTA